MRYAHLIDFDVVNGKGVGMSLFVQGCHFHCDGCFNPELWDFSKGGEWDSVLQEHVMERLSRDYVTRLSILGGEPLEELTLSDLLSLVTEVRSRYPTKQIWVYSGYCWEDIFPERENEPVDNDKRRAILSRCDVMVDGQFVKNLADPSLMFRGSSNQRIIDIQKSLETGSIVLWSYK